MTHQSRWTYVAFVFSLACAVIFGTLDQAQGLRPSTRG
jgi:hypothetical protein